MAPEVYNAAETIEVFPACPWPTRATLRTFTPSYTFTGSLLRQAWGGEKTRPEKRKLGREYRPAQTHLPKLWMLPRRNFAPQPSVRCGAGAPARHRSKGRSHPL